MTSKSATSRLRFREGKKVVEPDGIEPTTILIANEALSQLSYGPTRLEVPLLTVRLEWCIPAPRERGL